MRIQIPNLNGNEQYIENKQSIVLIGANGSGKTRMSVWIDEHNLALNAHRVSAQRSLNMPKSVSPVEMEVASEKLLYGYTDSNKRWLREQAKRGGRWGNEPEIHMLNDFQALMELLVTENYQKSIEYREKHRSGDTQFDNETRLEIIKRIWERVITHRKLVICAGKIEVTDASETLSRYNGSEMSDGERAIFHYIAEAVCAESESLIIIDEPENHLHNSILVRLWDAIESQRPDCTFLYVTHNLDFARTRLHSQIIWVKNMSQSDTWDYELLEEDMFADDLLMEILGDRQKILFVEGTPDRSTDRKLYPKLYPEFTVVPLESCTAVIQATKVYKQLQELHYKEVYGLVDRDRRTEDEIASLSTSNIIVPDVAEIENLFMLPDVIRIVGAKQNITDIEMVLSEVQRKTFEFLSSHIAEQALLFTRQRCMNVVNQVCNKHVSTVDEYSDNLASVVAEAKVLEVYSETVAELQKIIDDSEYLAALRVINNKGLMQHSGLPAAFGWKRNYYIDYVLRLLDSNEPCAKELSAAIREHIPL